MTRCSLLTLSLWIAFTGAAGFPLSCVDVARGAEAELASHRDCATLKGEDLMLAPTQLRQMRFEIQGLAAVWVAGHWYYVRSAGESLPVVTLDNGPDPFAEGLVRSPRQGRIAYVDAQFRADDRLPVAQEPPLQPLDEAILPITLRMDLANQTLDVGFQRIVVRFEQPSDGHGASATQPFGEMA